MPRSIPPVRVDPIERMAPAWLLDARHPDRAQSRFVGHGVDAVPGAVAVSGKANMCVICEFAA